jgi:HK97 family phage portal protein
VFDVKLRNPDTGRQKTEKWTADDALYIRGFNPFGFLTGVIPWQLFKEVLGNALAIEKFASYWWANQGALSTYISHPEKLSPTQAEEILDVFEETHGGLENAGRPALLSGGAKLEEARVSIADMQLEPSRGWEVSDICRMMSWSYDLINPSPQDRRKTEEVVLKAQKLYLQPRARRIRDAFNADTDLFKDLKYWLDVRFDPIEAPDAQTRAQANLQNRQAGIVTANELRIPMGLPPHEDGDSLQVIPVGGGANPDDPQPAKGGKGTKAPSSGYDPEGAPGGGSSGSDDS